MDNKFYLLQSLLWWYVLHSHSSMGTTILQNPTLLLICPSFHLFYKNCRPGVFSTKMNKWLSYHSLNVFIFCPSLVLLFREIFILAHIEFTLWQTYPSRILEILCTVSCVLYNGIPLFYNYDTYAHILSVS